MIKRKIKEWGKRYLLAEIIGTITAVGTASITHVFYESLVFIAYVGALGEAIGFYSTIFIQNILIVKRKHGIKNIPVSFVDLLKIIRTIILEFGPAGLIDGLLLRPFFMCLFPLLLENFTLGIFLGKIAGDFTFYILVILSYEMKNRKQNQ